MPEEKVTPEEATAAREFVLARLAVARAYASALGAGVDTCVVLFVDGGEDPTGAERVQTLDHLVELSGLFARAIEAAQDLIDDVDFTEGEPDFPEGDGFDEGEDEGDEDVG